MRYAPWVNTYDPNRISCSCGNSEAEKQGRGGAGDGRLGGLSRDGALGADGHGADDAGEIVPEAVLVSCPAVDGYDMA